MVFQNYALYPHMTVFENMAFGLKLRKVEKSEIKERVNYAAQILGIENLLDRKPKQLSGGQRQRVAVGRAIVRKPKVFLFDEPLSNLDAKLRVQMRSELARIHQKLETTVVYVTHDQTEAMTMGSRIVVMKDGIVHQVDTPMNLYNSPVNKFVAGFIGSPAMNFINGKIVSNNGIKFETHNRLILFLVRDDQSKKLESFINKNVTLGIRPENFIESSGENDSLNIELEVVEQMGSEVYVYFHIDQTQITARLKPDAKYKHGAKVNLSFDKNKIHFFDETTGNVIS